MDEIELSELSDCYRLIRAGRTPLHTGGDCKTGRRALRKDVISSHHHPRTPRTHREDIGMSKWERVSDDTERLQIEGGHLYRVYTKTFMKDHGLLFVSAKECQPMVNVVFVPDVINVEAQVQNNY